MALDVVVDPPLGTTLRVVLDPIGEVGRVIVGHGVIDIVVGSRLLSVVIEVLLAASHQVLLL